MIIAKYKLVLSFNRDYYGDALRNVNSKWSTLCLEKGTGGRRYDYVKRVVALLCLQKRSLNKIYKKKFFFFYSLFDLSSQCEFVRLGVCVEERGFSPFLHLYCIFY